ncbi:MAG TPA: ferrichrome ABC transporter permease, partial [Candidatus Methylomirabilis sp.]|nr:ferrichrome ABC transporter permease [Candidatus Methylomirabilis sp.]
RRASDEVLNGAPEAGSATSRGVKVLWVLLPACASTLLLAITNHLTQNVASVPFLWVLPLSLYLLSFILCFEGRTWYQRGLFLRLFAVAVGGLTYLLWSQFINPRLLFLLPLLLAALFVCCMVFHGELARLKPPSSELTSFYLMMAVGGALGGLFVGLVAPRVFNDFWELPMAIGGGAVLILVVLRRDPESPFYGPWWRPAWLMGVALTLAVITNMVVAARHDRLDARVKLRNFYGTLRVVDVTPASIVLIQGDRAQRIETGSGMRELLHGTTNHGSQFLRADKRRQPATYYGLNSGIGRALRELRRRGPLRVGVLGLGAGAIACYSAAGDHFTFYEINPLVIRLAREEFSFLTDSP